MLASGSLEDICLKSLDAIYGDMVFVGIDKEICLQEDLPVYTLHFLIGMVMGDEEADSFYLLLGVTSYLLEQLKC